MAEAPTRWLRKQGTFVVVPYEERRLAEGGYEEVDLKQAAEMGACHAELCARLSQLRRDRVVTTELQASRVSAQITAEILKRLERAAQPKAKPKAKKAKPTE